MAYIPPLGNAINFDGSGAAYTPPLGNAVNFDTVGDSGPITLVGRQATASVGALSSVISGGDFYAALSGAQVIIQQNVLLASVPGENYSIPLVGQGVTLQRGVLAAASVYSVGLTTQLLVTQFGGIAASTPTSTTVPLITQALTVQRGALTAVRSTGVIQWTASDANITLSGTPKLTASTFSSPYPTVYSNGDGAAAGGKRYVEVAISGVGVDQAFGLGNNWFELYMGPGPLGIDNSFSQAAYAWALWLRSDGTLQSTHNGVGTAQGPYSYVSGAPVMIAVDFDAGLVWLGYNGTWVSGGDPVNGINPTYTGVTGFPHPVTILGSMKQSTSVLHATVSNQQFRPAGFLSWEDSFGADVSVALTGQQLTTQKGGFGVIIFADPDVLIMLLGISTQVRFNLMGIDRNRQKVTWNPNDKNQYVVLTHGNLGAANATDTPDQSVYGTPTVRATVGRSINSGKYYFEVTVPHIESDPTYHGPGIMISRQLGSTLLAENTTWNGFLVREWDYVSNRDCVREHWFNLHADSGLEPGTGANWGDLLGEFVPNRVLQLAVDFNAGRLWFGYNNKWFGNSNPATGVSPQYSNIKTVITTVAFAEYPATTPDYTAGEPQEESAIGHFSAASFQFAPPTGFLPWEESDPVDRVIYLTGQQLLIWGTPFWHLEGRSLTVQQGHFPAIRAGDEYLVYLDGLEATIARGAFSGSNEFGTDGVYAIGAVGNLTVVISPSTASLGLEMTVQQGALASSFIQDMSVALVGAQLDMTQGAFSVAAGYNIGLAGITVGVAGGALIPEIAVKSPGLALVSVVGALGVDLVLVLGGSQCAVQAGVLRVTVAPILVGQLLSTAFGEFVPELALRPVGVQVQVSQGAPVSLLSLSLSGLSLMTHGGVLQLAIAVPLTGQQATVMHGNNGYMYDCNISITGVEAVGTLGAEPLLTNVPKPKKDVYMWAKYEVEKLFIQIAPEDLLNDIEPTD